MVKYSLVKSVFLFTSIFGNVLSVLSSDLSSYLLKDSKIIQNGIDEILNSNERFQSPNSYQNFAEFYSKLSTENQIQIEDLKSKLYNEIEIDKFYKNELLKLKTIDLYLNQQNQQQCNEIVQFWFLPSKLNNQNLNDKNSNAKSSNLKIKSNNPFFVLSTKLDSIQIQPMIRQLKKILMRSCSNNWNEIVQSVDSWVFNQITPEMLIIDMINKNEPNSRYENKNNHFALSNQLFSFIGQPIINSASEIGFSDQNIADDENHMNENVEFGDSIGEINSPAAPAGLWLSIQRALGIGVAKRAQEYAATLPPDGNEGTLQETSTQFSGAVTQFQKAYADLTAAHKARVQQLRALLEQLAQRTEVYKYALTTQMKAGKSLKLPKVK